MDPDKLKAVKKRFVTERIAELKAKGNRRSVAENIRLAQYEMQLARMEAGLDSPLKEELQEPENPEDEPPPTVEETIEARLAYQAAMTDPANWGPFCRDGYKPVDDHQLAEALDDADIVVDDAETFPGFEYIEGYLGPQFDYAAFFVIKSRTPNGPHLISAPDVPE